MIDSQDKDVGAGWCYSRLLTGGSLSCAGTWFTENLKVLRGGDLLAEVAFSLSRHSILGSLPVTTRKGPRRNPFFVRSYAASWLFGTHLNALSP